MYKKDLRTGDRLIYRDGTERVLQLNTAMGDVLTNLDGEIKARFHHSIAVSNLMLILTMM